MSDAEWDDRSGSMNRETVSELIGQGQHQGLLAYDGRRVIGWCHAAPRHTLGRLMHLLQNQGYDASDRRVPKKLDAVQLLKSVDWNGA